MPIFPSPTEILALQRAATRNLPNLARTANVDTTKTHVHKCLKTDCASWHMGPGRLVDETTLPRIVRLQYHLSSSWKATRPRIEAIPVSISDDGFAIIEGIPLDCPTTRSITTTA
jgi:hypothetical protein